MAVVSIMRSWTIAIQNHRGLPSFTQTALTLLPKTVNWSDPFYKLEIYLCLVGMEKCKRRKSMGGTNSEKHFATMIENTNSRMRHFGKPISPQNKCFHADKRLSQTHRKVLTSFICPPSYVIHWNRVIMLPLYRHGHVLCRGHWNLVPDLRLSVGL